MELECNCDEDKIKFFEISFHRMALFFRFYSNSMVELILPEHLMDSLHLFVLNAFEKLKFSILRL